MYEPGKPGILLSSRLLSNEFSFVSLSHNKRMLCIGTNTVSQCVVHVTLHNDLTFFPFPFPVPSLSMAYIIECIVSI